ncbi:MAG: hypothetical protein QG661_2771 [Actinomycetota bacterium]|nr:hypothetical protein [Actinomycetota bacterium]
MRLRLLLATLLIGGALATTGSAVASAHDGHAEGSAHVRQTIDLMAYNGYFALNTSPDAFFYVNTTMTATQGGKKRAYSISLDVSLDGQKAYSATFDGRFTGNRLVQTTPGGPRFDLRFTRVSRTLGTTARIAGTVTLPGQKPVTVTGTTYSNPTPAAFWGGQTYYAPAAAGGQPTPTVRMTDDGGIYYRSGPRQRWVRATSYTYNLDMYYFALKDRDLIMGTAGQSGMVANELMSGVGGAVTQLESVTLPNETAPTTGAGNWYPNLTGGPLLGDFSGYYPIPTERHPRAFVSIEGSSLADPSLSPDDLYRVLISVSTDGRSVRSWYYDVLGVMTFDGRTLRMPAQGITLRLERRYDTHTGTLFNLAGTIDGRAVRGQSSFNPIPVSAFAGTMTDKAGQHTLVITPSGDVTLDGQAVPNYEYVPTMYILAGPLPGTTADNQPVTVLSLGFSGASGRTAIVTTSAGTPQAQTFTVSAIPNP